MVVYDGLIQECDIFVWELEPSDTSRRSAREWIYEHITSCLNFDEFCKELGWDGECAAFEAVFEGEIRGWYDYLGEWEEELIVKDFISQPLPSQWFESPFGDPL
jgi:hypothetical protein